MKFFDEKRFLGKMTIKFNIFNIHFKKAFFKNYFNLRVLLQF